MRRLSVQLLTLQAVAVINAKAPRNKLSSQDEFAYKLYKAQLMEQSYIGVLWDSKKMTYIYIQ